MNGHIILVLAVLSTLTCRCMSWRSWACVDHRCIKSEAEDPRKSVSLGECKAACLEHGGLWPRPTGVLRLGNGSSQVDLSMIRFEKHEFSKGIEELLNEAQNIFLNRIKHADESDDFSKGIFYSINIKLEIYDPSVKLFATNVDESYKLRVKPPERNSEVIQVEVEANTFFGCRHGLETLSQLFFYDEIRHVHKMINEAHVEDKPVFTHRGIVLDTARSYIGTDKILTLLDLMAINKLNTFHWHITDSQSFPYVSDAYPELSRDGAYSEHEVYSQSDIKNIVRYALIRGIRVVPELDAPAHVGEGWKAVAPDLVTCFKWQPWRDYCVEPPCGQLDPTNDKVYDVLATIFKEYVHLFHSDLFHMGGDEVNINCWRSTPRIQEWMSKNNYSKTDSGFYRLWGEYQEKALKKLKATKSDPHPQAVLWTSTLTEPHLATKYLRPEDYVVQIWTLKTDPTIKFLLENKFRVIFSNYDELYFDCGGPSWVGRPGQNWCSPYIGWQQVYHHSPYEILRTFQRINITEETKKLVLGSEAAIWTEQIDEHNLNVRLWPRAAALAERLWSDPKQDWKAAQFRMNHHRQRLAKSAPAELLQPRWCYQNDGFCD